MPLALDDLRRFAVRRTLFPPTTLTRAIEKLGFVQADPIRAPARAQDLTLRHRVRDYRTGDLERRYGRLAIEEDFFVNYGFLPRATQVLMHPRSGSSAVVRGKKAKDLLEFVASRPSVHPREVDDHFAHGTVTNYWGGSSSATTHLLTRLHYGGALRVSDRAAGIRLYAVHTHAPGPADAAGRRAAIDRLVDAVVHVYAPLPSASLGWLVNRLRYAVPQWQSELRRALPRAKARLAHARVDGTDWYWPAGERPERARPDARVRFLAPFDPIVWDRRRFELLWNWTYRFEAYTPASKRRFGYYALPLLWRDQVIGWGNLSVAERGLRSEIGYVRGRPPSDRTYARELAAELDRMRAFLRLE
jgi:uncharacterized protein YcaQ